MPLIFPLSAKFTYTNYANYVNIIIFLSAERLISLLFALLSDIHFFSLEQPLKAGLTGFLSDLIIVVNPAG